MVVELIDFKKIKNRNISCSELGSRCPSSLQYPHVLSSSFDYTLYCQDLKEFKVGRVYSLIYCDS